MVNFEKIEGLMVIPIENYFDSRGSFSEINNQGLQELISVKSFVQTNFLESKKGSIRGLHFQIGTRSQNKLLMVSRGEIFDVVLDLRKSSATYLALNSISLVQKSSLLFIPSGCAHGFQTISRESHVIYQTDIEYSSEFQFGINPLDSDLGIKWPIRRKKLSERDQNLPMLREYLENG